jgi:plastocyanin
MHRRLHRAALTAAFVVAAVASLAACTTAAQSAGPVATDRVDLPRSYRFAPAEITVPVGTTVTWTNNDQFSHSVRLEGGPDLVARPGESVTYTFEAAGFYPYTCTFHPNDMDGSVLVTGR